MSKNSKIVFCLIRGTNDTIAAFVIDQTICACKSLPAPYVDVEDEVNELRDIAHSVSMALGINMTIVDLPKLHSSRRWSEIGMSYEQVKQYIVEGVSKPAQLIPNHNKAPLPSSPKNVPVYADEELPAFMTDHT